MPILRTSKGPLSLPKAPTGIAGATFDPKFQGGIGTGTIGGQTKYFAPSQAWNLGGGAGRISPEVWATGTPYTYTTSVAPSGGLRDQGMTQQQMTGMLFDAPPDVAWTPGQSSGFFNEMGLTDLAKTAAIAAAIYGGGGLLAGALAPAAGTGSWAAGLEGAGEFAGLEGAGLTGGELAGTGGLTALEASPWAAMTPEAMSTLAPSTATSWAAMTPEALGALAPSTTGFGGALEALQAGDIGGALGGAGGALWETIKKNPMMAAGIAGSIAELLSGPATYDFTGGAGGVAPVGKQLPKLPPLSRTMLAPTGDITQYGKSAYPEQHRFFRRGGSTGALASLLPSRYMQGPGGGQDDLIDAKVANGEYAIDASTVSDLGDGSNEEGANRLDMMIRKIREHKRGGRIKLPPRARSPLDYLKTGR